MALPILATVEAKSGSTPSRLPSIDAGALDALGGRPRVPRVRPSRRGGGGFVHDLFATSGLRAEMIEASDGTSITR